MSDNILTVEIHCPYCESVYDTVVISEQLSAAHARIAELEALHDALRTMGQAWLDLAATNERYQSSRSDTAARTLRNCAHDLTATFDAALAGDEPAKE